MPDHVTIREDLGIIQVDSYGLVTSDDLHESLRSVVALHKETGFTELFVNAMDQTSLPTTFPLHTFGELLVQEIPYMRISVAGSQVTKDDLRFLEDVVVNRGGQLRIFESLDAALSSYEKNLAQRIKD